MLVNVSLNLPFKRLDSGYSYTLYNLLIVLPCILLAPIFEEKEISAMHTNAQSNNGLVKLEYKCATELANSDKSSVSLCSAPPSLVSSAATL